MADKNKDDTYEVVNDFSIDAIKDNFTPPGAKKKMTKKIVQRLLHDSDQNGMGIINVPDEIKRKGGKAWLTVNAQGKDDVTPSAWHSEFSTEDWEDFKKNLNDNGRGITKVWIDDEEDVEDEIDANDNGKIEKDEMADFQKSLDDYAAKNKKGRDDIPTVTTRR